LTQEIAKDQYFRNNAIVAVLCKMSAIYHTLTTTVGRFVPSRLQPLYNHPAGIMLCVNHITLHMRTGAGVDYWTLTAKYGEIHHPACSSVNPNHNIVALILPSRAL